MLRSQQVLTTIIDAHSNRKMQLIILPTPLLWPTFKWVMFTQTWYQVWRCKASWRLSSKIAVLNLQRKQRLRKCLHSGLCIDKNASLSPLNILHYYYYSKNYIHNHVNACDSYLTPTIFNNTQGTDCDHLSNTHRCMTCNTDRAQALTGKRRWRQSYKLWTGQLLVTKLQFIFFFLRPL